MKKILIISSNRLGDCILSSGLNLYFKKKIKNSNLTFVCGDIPSDFFKYCKNIDNLIIFKKKKLSLHWLILWTKVVLNKWELVIDLRGSVISFFLFSKKKIKYKKQKSIIKKHKVEDVTSYISGMVLNPQVNLSKNKKFQNKNLKKIKELKKNNKLIMIAPTANWKGKIWPAQRYKELILKLKKQKMFKKTIFIITGPENEKKLIRDIFNIQKDHIYDLFGNSNLVEIFHVMKLCDLFIGNDSGLMHMASLSNIKTVGLFGPSDKDIYGPWGKKNLVITSTKSPEDLMGHKNFNYRSSNNLMLELKTEKVVNLVKKYFKGNV